MKMIMKIIEDFGQKLQENLINNKELDVSIFEYEVRSPTIKPEKYAITDAENGFKSDKTGKVLKNVIEENSKTKNSGKISTEEVKNNSEATEIKILMTNDENGAETFITKKMSKFDLYHIMFMHIILPLNLCVLLIIENDFSENSLFGKILLAIISPLVILTVPIEYIFDRFNLNEIVIKPVNAMIVSFLLAYAIKCVIKYLWHYKHRVLVVSLLVLSGVLGIEFALWYSYDIGLIMGFSICFFLLQLGLLFMPLLINFKNTSIIIIIEEYLFTIIEFHFIVFYPNLDIFLAIFTHISVLYSIGWLMMHIQLLREFGETHLFGSVALYSNIFALIVKVLLALHFYKN